MPTEVATTLAVYVTLAGALFSVCYFIFRMEQRALASQAAIQASIEKLTLSIERNDATERLLQAILELRSDLRDMRSAGSKEHEAMMRRLDKHTDALADHADSHARIETKLGVGRA